MIIKMLKTAQGPMGCFLKGKEIPVSDEFGEQLIKSGSAIKISKDSEPKKEEVEEVKEEVKEEEPKSKNPFKRKNKKK